MRLDNTVYRAGFATSRDQARQQITHGHFEVNGKKVTIPSFQVKVTDVVTIKPNSVKMRAFEGLAETLKNSTAEISEWINIDIKELSATVVDVPSLEKTPAGFDLKLITEFYSR